MNRFPCRPLVLTFFLAVTESARADSLPAALADAYRNNAAIEAGRLQLQATDEGVPEARAGWRPSVSLTGGVSREHQYFGINFPGATPLQNLTQTTAALTINQPLFRAGAVDAAIAAAQHAVEAGEASLSGTEQDQLLAAASAYLDCWLGQAVVSLNQTLVQVLDANRHDVETTFKSGAATETDTSQAQARLAGAIAGHLGAEAQLETARARFRSVVGRDPGALEAPQALGMVPASEADAAAVAHDHAPDILAARRRRDTAVSQAEEARAALLPRLDAVGQLQHTDDSFLKGVKQNIAGIGVQATVPIFASGGIDYARIRAARDAVAADDRLVLDAERQADARVAGAWNALRAAEAELAQYRAAIAANQVALDDTREEVTVGTRTRLDVLNAEQELFGSQVSLVSAEHDRLLALFQLEVAEGAFTPKALGLGVEEHDPSVYRAATDERWIGTTPPPP